jgi:hypothetical protein
MGSWAFRIENGMPFLCFSVFSFVSQKSAVLSIIFMSELRLKAMVILWKRE